MRLVDLLHASNQYPPLDTPLKARTFLGHDVEVTGAELRDGVIYIELGLLEGV